MQKTSSRKTCLEVFCMVVVVAVEKIYRICYDKF